MSSIHRLHAKQALSLWKLCLMLTLSAMTCGCHARVRDDLVGHELQPIEAEGWLNGEGPSAEELQGEVVLVNIWAHWCGPCRGEASFLAKLHEEYAPRGVRFVGLTHEGGDALEQNQEFLRTGKITWPNGYGAGETLRRLGVTGLPTVLVVGKDGRVAWAATASGMEGMVEPALDRELDRSS